MQFEYYSLLEIERTATSEEIKKAYRKKAMELHPDRHGGDKTKEAEFKKLNEAYSVLSDEQKKAHYDRFGSMEGHGNPFGGGGFQQGFDVDLGDIFSSFFGGGFQGGASSRRKIGDDIEIELRISLEDALQGTSRKIQYSRNIICESCDGKGGTTETCDMCRGAGQIRERMQTIFGTMEQARPCPKCHGTGEKIREKCTSCHGNGYTQIQVEKTIEVPPGIESGMSIKMRGEGQTDRDGNGDLYITFLVPEKEGGLTRDGANLHYNYTISPALAVLGDELSIDIPIIGKKHITIKPGTQPDADIIFRGEGAAQVNKKGSKGDLIIHIVIAIPTKISKDEANLYAAILDLEAEKGKKKSGLKGLFSDN